MDAFVCLMYHNISDSEANRYDVNTVNFCAQLTWLKTEGYVIEGFDGLARRFVSNEWPERYVVMTFDDGHRSNLLAAEIISTAGGRASFFLTRHFSETRKDYLQEAEIHTLATLGEIGSHSLSHADLARLPANEIRRELVESKHWLEDIIGTPVTSFGAPNGSINRAVADIAFASGYTVLGNSVEWWNTVPRLRQRALVNRYAIRYHHDLRLFARIVQREPGLYWQRRLRATALKLPKMLLSSDQIRHWLLGQRKLARH